MNTPLRSTTYRNKQRARFRREQAPCALCGLEIDYELKSPDPMSFEVDHKKSIHRYPELAYDPSNGQASHRRCNRAKSNKEFAPIIRRSGSLK